MFQHSLNQYQVKIYSLIIINVNYCDLLFQSLGGSDTINYEEAEGSESNNETIELERSVANASCSHQMNVSDAELTAAVLDMSSTANGITLLENLLSSPSKSFKS